MADHNPPVTHIFSDTNLYTAYKNVKFARAKKTFLVGT